jgi:transposase-like protein
MTELQPTKPSDQIRAAGGSPSGDAALGPRLPPLMLEDDRLRAEVLALLSDGRLCTEVQQATKVSKRRLIQWRHEGIAAGILQPTATKGRPRASAYNDEKRAKVFILLSKNETITAISKETGVSESTIKEWKQKGFAIMLQNSEIGSSATPDGIPHDDGKYAEVYALLNQRKGIKTISRMTKLPESTISCWNTEAIAAGIAPPEPLPQFASRRCYEFAARDQVLALFKQNFTAREIADKTKVPSTTVHTWKLKAVNAGELSRELLAGQPRYDNETRAQALTLVKHNLPIAEVARKCKIPVTTICRWRDKAIAAGEFNPGLLTRVLGNMRHDEQTRVQVLELIRQNVAVADVARKYKIAAKTIRKWKYKAIATGELNPEELSTMKVQTRHNARRTGMSSTTTTRTQIQANAPEFPDVSRGSRSSSAATLNRSHGTWCPPTALPDLPGDYGPPLATMPYLSDGSGFPSNALPDLRDDFGSPLAAMPDLSGGSGYPSNALPNFPDDFRSPLAAMPDLSDGSGIPSIALTDLPGYSGSPLAAVFPDPFGPFQGSIFD